MWRFICERDFTDVRNYIHDPIYLRSQSHTHTPISEPPCFEQDGAAAESGSDEAAERAAEEAERPGEGSEGTERAGEAERVGEAERAEIPEQETQSKQWRHYIAKQN